MKTSIADLNTHLFDALERLMDDEQTPERLAQEIERSKAVTAVAGRIIELADTVIESQKLHLEYGNGAGAITSPAMRTLGLAAPESK